MANLEELSTKLADHERRIRLLEVNLKQDQPQGKKFENESRKSLPQIILVLRDSNFFTKPQTSNDVYQKIQTTYHCEPDRVTMALIRLADRKKLRKASKTVNKQHLNAYVW